METSKPKLAYPQSNICHYCVLCCSLSESFHSTRIEYFPTLISPGHHLIRFSTPPREFPHHPDDEPTEYHTRSRMIPSNYNNALVGNPCCLDDHHWDKKRVLVPE